MIEEEDKGLRQTERRGGHTPIEDENPSPQRGESTYHKGGSSKEDPTGTPTEAPTEEPKEEYIYRCSVHGPVEPVMVSGRLICPICRRFVSKEEEGGRGGVELLPLEPEVPEEEEEEFPEELTPLKPPEVSATERVRELLAKGLPRVYGVPKKEASKRIAAILDTLNPDIALNGQSLHAHIKRYAPNADDQHLQSIINNIFWNLRNEGYLPSHSQVPLYPSPPGVAPPVMYQTPYSQPTSPPGYPYQPQGPTTPYGSTPSPYGTPPYGPYTMPPQARVESRRMKIVIEGQEIETDFEGYMAWRRYQQDMEREKRENQKHELEMKKLEEEIKGIAGERGERKEEEGVPVRFGEETVKVPASVAPLYLTPRREKETLVPVKVGGETIQVPASLAPLYLRGDDEAVKRLGDEVKGLSEKLHEKELESRDKEMASRERLHERDVEALKGDLKAVRGELMSIKENQPTLEQQLDALDRLAERRGYTRTGRTTLDVVGEGIDKVDGTLRMLVDKLTPGGGGEFEPVVRRTPEERFRKAQEIEERMDRSSVLMEAEDDLIRSAGDVLRTSRR